MIDFDNIPAWWPICPGTGCERAGECLRHKAYGEVPPTVNHWPCVLPTALSDGECRYFQSAQTVRMACGFSGVMKGLKGRDLRHDLRLALTTHFGSKGSYYRYRDGERLMDPDEQEAFARILRHHGVDEPPVFDRYEDTYDFTHFSQDD